MMFEGKHIHYSPVDKKPLCSYSAKLCKQRRIKGYAFCIRHILEDKSAPFKQCAHVARYNKQKCTNPIPSNENREFCNSHLQVAGMLPKKERKSKKDKDKEMYIPCDGKLKFADRLRALLKKENNISCNDDPFNSDDPYAFPDPVTEKKNGCIGFSATPILRTAWNCSQKTHSDSMSSDSSVKGDQLPKNLISGDKLKSHTPKLSKTMNRLHAKIAQNKLLDKQKKTQDSSQSLLGINSINLPIIGHIKSEPLSPADVSISVESNDLKSVPELVKSELVNIKMEPIEDSSKPDDSIASNSLTFPSSPIVSQSQLDSHLSSGLNSCSSRERSFSCERSSSSEVCSSKEMPHLSRAEAEFKQEQPTFKYCKVPHALQKVDRVFKSKKKKHQDILPLGFETSESEGSDSEDDDHLFNQLSGFSVWDSKSSSSLQNMKFQSRSERQMELKRELRRSYQQLCLLNTLHKQGAACRQELVNTIISAARCLPNEVTQFLVKTTPKQKKINRPVDVKKATCCYQFDDSVCHQPPLPYARHCKKHIMYNVDQLLFEHCTAKFADNTQCCIPVFDISHELPLCVEHAKKRDNYNKMASEPKPKKPRKKPKPSALTRPAKRGKKKKKQNILRPTSTTPSPPPHTAPPAISIAVEMPSSAPIISEPVKASGIVSPSNDIPKDLNGQMDSELGSDLEDQFSPGAIEKTLELPLDTAELANQASKLLEEHDFTEVLNKIPDDAFNDLFVEARNGDYIPSKEETEELERALAAVSKDVHLAKESLAKLSATDPDLEELERTIDIHGGLLGAENLTSAIDESTFHELASSHIDGLNVITSTFSNSDLNSLSQALSGITAENLEQNHLPAVSDSQLISTPVVTVPLLSADMTHPHLLNGHSGAVAGLHSLHTDPNFTPQLLESAAAALNHPITQGSSQGTTDSRLLGNSSLLFSLGQTTAANLQTTFSNCHTSLAGNNNNSSEDTGLMSSPGGLTSTHWLLNSSDQVLTLSHMAYQNGFLVSSQAGGTYSGSPLLASFGKYPLQALSAEVSLVSSNSPLVTSATCSDNTMCGSVEQPLHSLNLSSRSTVSLQTASSAIAQEGAS